MTERSPKPRALVTGGAGFVGGHLVRRLVERGHAVRVLDLCEPAEPVSGVEPVVGSVLDPGVLREALSGIDWVFHLAANPNLWAERTGSFFEINHEGARAVVEAAAEAGAARIVYTSTESILVSRHGAPAAPIDETVVRTAEDMCGPYCLSKLRGEEAALAAARAGAPVVVVNPTMPVGPLDPRITPPTRMLMDFLNGKHPAYYEFAMNLVDVRDVALGHILAAERGRVGERYILGGENLRMSEVLAILGELTGLPMPRARIPYALALGFAAVSEFVADRVTKRAPQATVTGVRLAGAELKVTSEKAIRELGFAPSPIRAAIADAIRWMADAGHISRPLVAG